jgi:hypothetical protein
VKKYPFRFVARQGLSGVVEVQHDGITERCLLPMNVIIEAKTELTSAQIDTGVPYGLPFGEILSPQAEVALHGVDVWTLQDLYTKAQSAVGALNSVGLKLPDVIHAAEAYQKQDHTVIKAAQPVAHKKGKFKKEQKS